MRIGSSDELDAVVLSIVIGIFFGLGEWVIGAVEMENLPLFEGAQGRGDEGVNLARDAEIELAGEIAWAGDELDAIIYQCAGICDERIDAAGDAG